MKQILCGPADQSFEPLAAVRVDIECYVRWVRPAVAVLQLHVDRRGPAATHDFGSDVFAGDINPDGTLFSYTLSTTADYTAHIAQRG